MCLIIKRLVFVMLGNYYKFLEFFFWCVLSVGVSGLCVLFYLIFLEFGEEDFEF